MMNFKERGSRATGVV